MWSSPSGKPSGPKTGQWSKLGLDALVLDRRSKRAAPKANMGLITQMNRSDQTRGWAFVFAIARSWKMEDGKSLKNLAKYIPHGNFKPTWIPRLTNENSRKTFWVFRKRARLRHLGDVTIVLSKKGRNMGPKKIKILVTNLVDLTARQVFFLYQRRWPIEVLFRELKSGLGLGEHQVTKHIDRIEKSIAISIIAYLTLVRTRKGDIKPGQLWSIFQLKNNFTTDLICN